MDSVTKVLAALAAPGQAQRLLQLRTPLGGDVLVAESLTGVEQIDGVGFVFDVIALSSDANLSLDSLLGQPALLQMQAIGNARPFHGRITAAERIGSNGGLADRKSTRLNSSHWE